MGAFVGSGWRRVVLLGAQRRTDGARGRDRSQLRFRQSQGALPRLPLPDGDISPDGERFLVIKEGAAAAEFVIVVNWFEELKRLVPTDK